MRSLKSDQIQVGFFKKKNPIERSVVAAAAADDDGVKDQSVCFFLCLISGTRFL